MDKYLSRKFKIISLLAMFLVVIMHCDNGTVTFCDVRLIETVGSLNTFFELVVRLGITLVAVPFFFIISGYLFFHNIEGRWTEYKAKYKTRFKSLFIPYVFWNCFWIIIILLFNALDSSFGVRTQPINPVQDVISLADISVISALKRIVGFFIRSCPDSPLWYIRDLMIMVLCSPILFQLLKNRRKLFVIVLFLLFMGGLEILPLKVPYFFGYVLSGNFTFSLFFFSIGAYFAINDKSTVLSKCTSGKSSLILGVLWVVLLLLKYVLVLNDVEPFVASTISRFSILVGVLFVWTVYDYISPKYDFHHLNSLLPYTFFVYVFHFLIVKYIYLFLGTKPAVLLLNGILTPIIIVAVSMLIAFVLKKYIPSLYNYVTGSR